MRLLDKFLAEEWREREQDHMVMEWPISLVANRVQSPASVQAPQLPLLTAPGTMPYTLRHDTKLCGWLGNGQLREMEWAGVPYAPENLNRVSCSSLEP
ncbi:unnamed protein product [Caretta caretta]